MKVVDKLKRKINNLFHPILGEVWMLHRVVPEEQRSRIKSNRELEVTPEFLESKISDYKRSGFEFLSMDEMVRRVDEYRFGIRSLFCFKKKSKYVAITFDDGYRDNYDIAFPLLKRNNVPFCINVTTDFLENKALLWWYVLEDLGVSDVEFEFYRREIFSLTQEEITRAFERWFLLKDYSFQDTLNRLAMTIDQVIQLSNDPLCTIGCHTLTHPRLDHLSYNDQEKEIVCSKRLLESIINNEVRHFAFPYGFYDLNTIKILQSNNISSAVRTWGGCIRKGESLLVMNRINVTQD